jgi:hydrogenase-4 component D
LFIFWELTTLCSWALISQYQDEEKAVRAGYKALIMTHVGGLFLMTAIVLVFVNTRSFEFTALNLLPDGLKNTVILLIMVAAWAKAAQVPFYTWLPDAMEAPTPVSAYLHGAAMVKAGIYLVARTVVSAYSIDYSLGLVLAIMAMLTVAVGVFLFFFQDDLKRLLALSTITHLAYILLAFALYIFGSYTAFTGGLLHIAAHATGKGLLFLSVGALSYFTGTRKMSELRGALTRFPIIALGFFIGAFTVTGVPPFAGFWSKFYIITGALSLGGVGSLFGVLLLLESVVAFGWFLWVGQKIFLGEPSPAVARAHGDAPAITIVLVVLMILCLVIPVIALPIIQWIR